MDEKFVWMARGFGGRPLMLFPEKNLTAIFTGWEILKHTAPTKDLIRISRSLPAMHSSVCAQSNNKNPRSVSGSKDFREKRHP